MTHTKATQPLPHTRDEIGQPCGLCKRVVREDQHDPDMLPELGCSEFCASVQERELAEFRAASVGTYCVYPCPGCGVPMEDEWHDVLSEDWCSECHEKWRTENRVNVLRKCRDVFEASAYEGSVWRRLRVEIDAAIEGKPMETPQSDDVCTALAEAPRPPAKPQRHTSGFGKKLPHFAISLRVLERLPWGAQAEVWITDAGFPIVTGVPGPSTLTEVAVARIYAAGWQWSETGTIDGGEFCVHAGCPCWFMC